MKKVTDYCSGCSACVEKCPKGAISMININGFDTAIIDKKKCVDCSICHKMCPMNKEKKNNNPDVKIARVKNLTDNMKSTSGGLFGELARYIVSEGGICYGATFADDYKSVNHIRVEKLEDIDKILKSKYVRSDIKATFTECEKDLKKEKQVLFSGTPCQIAGLKSFLKKDYENLFTVDIICHGTPSPLIWKRYVEELEKNEKSKVTYVDFRYFNKEEPLKNFLIKFENGSCKELVLADSSYGKAFLVGLINSPSCDRCEFNDFRNYSDITLGDPWGYKNKKYPAKNSLIFINTASGEKLYESIRNKLIEFSDFSLNDLLPSCYPILHSTYNHYNYNKVDINAKDIDKELFEKLDELNSIVKDDNGVGILNFHYENYNFGANLVAYSLSKVVEKLGYTPWVIDFDPFDDLDTVSRYRTEEFLRFRKKYLNMTPRFKKKEELKVLNNYLDMFIVGSDQVWRRLITNDNLTTYFLDFVKDKNKLSYAASFGSSEFDCNELEKEYCKNALSSFYDVSVREASAVGLCEKEFNCTPKVVLDPTLLLDREEYEKLIIEEYDEKIDVAVYFVIDYDNVILDDPNFERLCKKRKITNIKGHFEDKIFGKVFVYNSISKWLDGIRKCNILITDSYHGVLFSIIFNKQVICIGKNKSSLSRFKSLFEKLEGNFDKNFYLSLDEIKSLNSNISYKKINEKLKKLKEESIEFLRNGLGKEKIKKADLDKEILIDYIKKLSLERDELQEKYYAVDMEYQKILNSRSWKITEPVRVIKKKIEK